MPILELEAFTTHHWLSSSEQFHDQLKLSTPREMNTLKIQPQSSHFTAVHVAGSLKISNVHEICSKSKNSPPTPPPQKN